MKAGPPGPGSWGPWKHLGRGLELGTAGATLMWSLSAPASAEEVHLPPALPAGLLSAIHPLELACRDHFRKPVGGWKQLVSRAGTGGELQRASAQRKTGRK